MIREAKIDDIGKLSFLASEFMGETKFLKVDDDVFFKTWENLINLGIGTIFIIDDFHGALGAVAYPDPNNGEMMATEMFWIVAKEHRGKGLLLLERYEQWAKEKGCTKAIMVHLKDSMPERLKALYGRSGYEEMETHYIKEL